MKRLRPKSRSHREEASAEETADRPHAWFATTRRADAATRALRIVLIASIACGPAALGIHWFAPNQANHQEAAPSQHENATSALGPTGWAERAISAYLEGDVEAVQVFFPTASDNELPEASPDAEEIRTTTVAANEIAEGYWGVTVAVSVLRTDPQAPVARFYSVGVASSGAGWVAANLPSEVAVPRPGDAPELAYASHTMPTGAVTQTVEQWAGAYLTADGELDRYLAPGYKQDPISPAPYDEVKLRAVHPHANHDEKAQDKRPSDGTVVDVLAHLEATDASEESSALTYALELTARSGRWEVSALRPAPLQSSDTEQDNAPD